MSQNDLVIANQTFPNTRADINSALQALGSLSSGATEPSTTYANMLWYDIANNTLKMRAEANDAWISVAYLDQSTDAFRILDDTQVVNTSGTQTGLLGDQATATWEAGTSTTESLVSPAKVKASIEALVPDKTTAGGVGTYAFARKAGTALWGASVAGSDLIAAGGVANELSDANTAFNSGSVVLSGTWRCMGDQNSNNPGGDHPYSWTLFLRIV